MPAPIDGQKLTVTGTGGVYFIPQTSIFAYRLIDLSTEGQNGGRDTSVVQKTAGHIGRIEINDAPTGRTVARIDRTQ